MAECSWFVPSLVLLLGLAGCGGYVETPLPQDTGGPDIHLEPPDVRLVEARVARNATLATLLESHDLGDVAYAFVESMRSVFDPRDLQIDHPYKLFYDGDDRFQRFEYHVDEDQYLQVDSRHDAEARFEATLVDYEKEREEIAMYGAIDRENNSLTAAMDAGGGGIGLAMSMAEVFAGAIDFNTELQPGDHFYLLYERFVRDEVHVTYGDVIAATFHNDGRDLSAFRYEVPGEDPGYYDAEGRSLKRQFLKSPLPFEPRITSRFSYRRLHPILGTRRAHLGVDYGAPTGTPVQAVARGTVEFAAAAAARATWSSCVTPTATRPTTCTCRASRRGFAPACGSCRGRPSGTSGRPGSRPVRTSTTGSARTACSSTRSSRSATRRPATRCRRTRCPGSAPCAIGCRWS